MIYRETETGLTIVRHENDRMTSVYRGAIYLGSALPTLRRSDYAVIGWSAIGPEKERAEHATEQAAIDYLDAPPKAQNAPDLLEVLQDLLDWEQHMGGWDAPCWLRARQAVHKAGRKA